MNNKLSSSNIIVLSIVIAVVIFCAGFFLVVKPKFEEYQQKKLEYVDTQAALKNAQREIDDTNSKLQKEEDLLKTIKVIYTANETANADNLSVFGTMFDDVIQRIQQNGLMIRSIEYQMSPDEDILQNNFGKDYNVCTLKFFVIGSYAQLRALMEELNGSFPYLLNIANTNVLVYQENTDYILADLSITLYSKKPTQN